MIVEQRAWDEAIPISSTFRLLAFELNWNVFRLSPHLVIFSSRNMHLCLFCARCWVLAWKYKWNKDSLSTDLFGELVGLGGENVNSTNDCSWGKGYDEKVSAIRVCIYDLIYWNGPEKESRRQSPETNITVHGNKSKDVKSNRTLRQVSRMGIMWL